MFLLSSREMSKGRVVYVLLAVVPARILQWWLEFSSSDVGCMWEVEVIGKEEQAYEPVMAGAGILA